MRIQVRKCPFTGEIFEEKNISGYIRHLKLVRDMHRESRKFDRIRKQFHGWLAEEKSKITHPDMIPTWFLDNQRIIMDAYNAGLRAGGYGNSDRDKFYTTDKFTVLQFTRGEYNPLLSNSHCCPDNGQTNWCGRNKSLPQGYPGWRVYINGSLMRKKAHDGSYPYSDALNLVGIKTGSGGGGNGSWSYDASIFLDDWPGLIQTIKDTEALEIVKRLKGLK